MGQAQLTLSIYTRGLSRAKAHRSQPKGWAAGMAAPLGEIFEDAELAGTPYVTMVMVAA